MASNTRRQPHRREEDNLRAEIARLRESKGISQRELSTKLGLHPMTVGKIERGERSVSVMELVDISEALDVTPFELLTSAIQGR